MLEQQITEFITYLETIKSTAANTIISYKRDLTRMASYMEERGINDAAMVTEDRLSDYAASLKDEHFAPSSITRHFASIKAFFRYMLENGNVDENPADILKCPKIEKSKPRVLTTIEIENLLSQDFSDDAKGIRDRAILELMYATGLKTSEVIGLKLSNIDLNLNCLRMDKNAKAKGERLIPYGKKAREALIQYLKEARNSLLLDSSDETVFINCSGSPMSRQGLWKLIKTYVKKAGIKSDITPIVLRHSFATHLVENGADVASIQELMGYSESNNISRYMSKKGRVSDPYEWARIRNL